MTRASLCSQNESVLSRGETRKRALPTCQTRNTVSRRRRAPRSCKRCSISSRHRGVVRCKRLVKEVVERSLDLLLPILKDAYRIQRFVGEVECRPAGLTSGGSSLRRRCGREGSACSTARVRNSRISVRAEQPCRTAACEGGGGGRGGDRWREGGGRGWHPTDGRTPPFRRTEISHILRACASSLSRCT